MARPKRDGVFDADDQTIIAHFDQSLELYERQKGASGEISENNKGMQDDGVHPGILSICRRLALMPPGKRGMSVALLHRYLQVLASRLEDPTFKASAEAKGEAATVPFARKVTAA